eukprot:scaffold3513_cov102-Cylindrotheca_fusiformis.AAC.7
MDSVVARMSASLRRHTRNVRLLIHSRPSSRHQTTTRIRFFSNNDIRIPDPTWSIRDLNLTSKRPPVPPEELQRLAKLTLIDTDSMSEDLSQELANMLHMIDQVSNFQIPKKEEEDDASDSDKAAKIYDVVRGVTKAPLRKPPDEDPLQAKDQETATNVWNSLLQPKTIRKGGRHHYFAIQTKQEE